MKTSITQFDAINDTNGKEYPLPMVLFVTSFEQNAKIHLLLLLGTCCHLWHLSKFFLLIPCY